MTKPRLVRLRLSLFVAYGPAAKRMAVAKPTISRWILEAIALAYSIVIAALPEAILYSKCAFY